MFQHYAALTYMTVWDNAAFGLKSAALPAVTSASVSPNSWNWFTSTGSPHRYPDGMARSGPAGRLGRGYEQRPARRPARATAKNWPAGIYGIHQSDGRSGCPCNGTKRARIGKASGSADRSFGRNAVRYMSVTIATP